jgi:hypothetical protein
MMRCVSRTKRSKNSKISKKQGKKKGVCLRFQKPTTHPLAHLKKSNLLLLREIFGSLKLEKLDSRFYIYFIHTRDAREITLRKKNLHLLLTLHKTPLFSFAKKEKDPGFVERERETPD